MILARAGEPCRSRIAAVVSLSLFAQILTVAGPAHAQPSSNTALAESLFSDGRALMGKKDYEHACPKLEESLRIEVTGPTLFVLAECLEASGKTASAWGRWREARDYARSKGKADKEKEADARASALEPKIPKVRIDVATAVSSLAGLQIKLDGLVMRAGVFGSDLPHDPGPVTLEVSATGKQTLKLTKTAAAGPVLVLSVASLVDAATAPTPSSTATVSGPPPTSSKPGGDTDSVGSTPGSTQRTVGLVMGGVGLAGIAVGGIFMAQAVSTNNSIKAKQGLPNCPGSACDSLVDKRNGQSTVGLVGLIGGGAALVGGLVVYITAPSAKTAASLVPTVHIAADPARGASSLWLEGSW